MNKLFVFVFLALIATAFAINVQPKEQEVKSIPLCLVCSFVVDRVDDYLKDHTNTTQIVDKVDHDCTKFKENHIVGECQRIVSNYLPEIINLLEKSTSPELCCKTIGLC